MREATPWQVDDASLAEEPSVQAILGDLATAVEQRAALEGLRAAVDAGTVTSQTLWKAWYRKGRNGWGMNQTEFAKPLADVKNGASFDDATAPIVQALDDFEAERREALQAAREAVREERESGLDRRAAHAELSFGSTMPGDSDPCSSVEPITLEIDGVTLAVKGQIDRVDWDPARRALAVRDYKSGSATSLGKLLGKTRRGLSLQLLLYARALEAMIERGDLPHLAGSRVAAVALEFTKAAAQAEFGPSEGSGLVPAGPDEPSALDELTLAELGDRWIGSHIRGIEAGRFDLLPEACPKVESGAWCDYERLCGFSPSFVDRFDDDRRRPALEVLPPPERAEREAPDACEVLAPRAAMSLDPAAAREAHDRASERIADPRQDAVVSAGAGTGKTYNLVRRYTAALADASAPDPQSILCVTFTRRAAGEMKQRIRAALLDDDAVARFDRPVLRGLILELSAAPISTLDALALRVVQERDAHLQRERPAEVSDPSAVEAELRSFVSERFLAACDERDPDLRDFLAEVTVGRARDALFGAIKSDLAGALGTTSARDIEDAWWRLADPLLKKAAGAAQGLDLGPARDALADPDALDEKRLQALQAVVSGAAALQARPAPVGEARRAAVASFWSVVNLGRKKDALQDWVRNELKPRRATFEQGLPSAEAAAFKALCGTVDLAAWADTAAAGARLIARWSREFDERLRSRGTLRYSDVTAMALEALGSDDEGLRAHLRSRLPFAHVFVDESQDTSETQVALIHALRALCDARLFWVGDPKQSIYRFRGAEVDVFEGLVRGASDGALRLQTNRRSSPALIRSLNRLFSALLPAHAGDLALDPRSEVDYSPLTWPAEVDDGGDGAPAIELIAYPGARWPLDEVEAEEEDEDEGDDHTDNALSDTPADAEPTPLEDALCRHIAVLAASTPRGDKPPIAILVHSWRRAERYRSLLALPAYDVPAAVQGGRGLLDAPEVAGVLHWLEAAAQSSDLGLLGALRGPGIAVSDAGLVCLKQGWGLRSPKDAQPPSNAPSLRRAATDFDLDPALAVEAWAAAAPSLDRAAATPTLAVDAASLTRFRAAWKALVARLQDGPLVDAAEALIDDLELEGWWMARPQGRQAVANLAAFVQLLRETEASLGSDGPAVLGALEASRGTDDPAAGGLDSGDGAAVVITTYWQAKGLEWPIVVLPDLQKTVTKSDSSALGSERVLDPAGGQPTHVAELQITTAAKPFSSSPVAISQLIDLQRQPALRAELRRLLYVAMTRPESRLLLSGVFARPNPSKATHAVPGPEDKPLKAFSLDGAKNWADTLLVCTGLRFLPDGTPQLGDGLWTADDVVLRSVADVAVEDLPTRSTQAVEASPPLPDLLARWTPVESTPRDQIRPSDAKSPTVPTPLLEPTWPEDTSPRSTPFGAMRHEGNAFHLLMELWGFGADGIPLDRELALRALTELDLAPHPRQEARIDRLLDLVQKASTDQPGLFERLQAAAQRGEVLHEVPLRFVDVQGRFVTGKVDLMWAEDGAWHILDYKAGWTVPTADDGLKNETLRKHHGQVQLYREGVSALLPAGAVASTGIWYVSRGLVVQWG